MTWFAGLSTGVLVVGWLTFALVVAAVSRVAFRVIVPAAEHDHVASIAAPLMPALGATFAVLMALTLSSEAAYLRSAQDIVSLEAAAAARLAWASTTPGVHTEPIQSALDEYVTTTRAREWHGTGATEGDDPEAAQALARLERVVRAEVARTDLPSPTTTDLLTALDSLSTE